jgi:hypothetical protein
MKLAIVRPGEKKTTSRAFSIKLTGKTSPAPLWPSRAPFASFRRSSFAPSRREGHACLCVPLAQSVLPVPSRPRRRAFGRNLDPDREPRHGACKVLPVVVASIAFFGRRTRIEDHEQCRSTQGFSGATNYARTLINFHRSVATSPPCERNRSLRINTKGHPRTDSR